MAINHATNVIGYKYRIQRLIENENDWMTIFRKNDWITIFPATYERDRVKRHFYFLLNTHPDHKFRLQRQPIYDWTTVE